MHIVLSLLLVILLLWFMFPKQAKKAVMIVPGEEMYKNEPSQIQFTNAEFKFYM